MEGMHDLAYFRANFDASPRAWPRAATPPNLDQFPRTRPAAPRRHHRRPSSCKARANEQSAEIGKLRREGADTAAQQDRCAP